MTAQGRAGITRAKVAKMLADGLTQADIGTRLGISRQAVCQHAANIRLDEVRAAAQAKREQQLAIKQDAGTDNKQEIRL